MADDVAKCLGDEALIEHKGKSYTLVPWDRYGIQRKFRAWMIQQAVLAQRDMRSFRSPDECREASSQLDRDVATGIYEWGGDIWERHLTSEAGLIQIFYLDLKVSHPEMTPELAREIIEAHHEEIHRVMTWLVTDPNSKTPREKTATS